MTPGKVLRFDGFELHPVERRLLVRGQPVLLGARAFDLLLALAQQGGALVTKDQLLDRVWPNLVVTENNVHVQVSALRKLIGGQAIRTVPGYGYRLAVQPLPEPAGSHGPAAGLAGARSPPRPAEMFGREDELALLVQLLAAHRLVSIVGPGGVGKSMLADAGARASVQAGQRGACWVDVHGLTEAQQLPEAVARALDGTDRAPAPPSDLAPALRASPALVVLDGAEHLLDAVARVAGDILDDAAGPRLLVTSQAALRVEGERVLRLCTLPIPAPGVQPDIAMRCGAVALFAHEAQAADQRFALDEGNVALVLDVCRRLDGLPLAIKLAAQRTHALGLTALRDLLPAHLQLLRNARRGAPARHQTLMASFDWSFRLLDEMQRLVLCRLAVFDGVFALDHATRLVAGGDLDPWAVMEVMASLVERSLIQRDAQALNAYRLVVGIRELACRLGDEAEDSGQPPGRL